MNMFQSRKRFRHCWSPGRGRCGYGVVYRFNRESDSVTVGALPLTLWPRSFGRFQSRKRFRHCWSKGSGCRQCWFDKVSIAKAIPSLLEPRRFRLPVSCLWCFNRESDSVTVGAPSTKPKRRRTVLFQSRKRFRHCWSACVAMIAGFYGHVSIAKAIPSLLEHGTKCDTTFRCVFQSRKRFRHCWSHEGGEYRALAANVSIAKAIPSLLEPRAIRRRRHKR